MANNKVGNWIGKWLLVDQVGDSGGRAKMSAEWHCCQIKPAVISINTSYLSAGAAEGTVVFNTTNSLLL